MRRGLLKRLAALEAVAPAGNPAADRRAWAAAMRAAVEPLGDPGLTNAMLAEHYHWCAWWASAASPAERGRHPWATGGRLPGAVRAFVRVCPDPAEAAAVLRQGLPPHPDRGEDCGWHWVWRAAALECRIPPDLSPAAYRAVAAVWPESFSPVCDRCGLMQADRHPRIPPCPHCGETAWTWNSRINEEEHPWQALAIQELAL